MKEKEYDHLADIVTRFLESTDGDVTHLALVDIESPNYLSVLDVSDNQDSEAIAEKLRLFQGDFGEITRSFLSRYGDSVKLFFGDEELAVIDFTKGVIKV